MARSNFGNKSSGASLLQWLGLAFIILLADQFTKVLIVQSDYQSCPGLLLSPALIITRAPIISMAIRWEP